MPVIDVQVHPFDGNHPGRPWASPSHGLGSATGEEMVAATNSVGVDGAIMVSSFSAYEYDPSYALEVYSGLRVNLLCQGILDKGLPHIQRHRDTVIVIDHLGLLQPARPPVPADVWADLPKLLALAQYENVRVKISGTCTMSHQPFPYDDIWEPVLRVIDVRAGSLHVGHRLDADDRHADP